MEMESLQDLFVSELQDLYHAENQIIKALPKMIKKTSADELKSAFETHLEETRHHVERLEQVFDSMGEKAKAKPCKAMKGIIAEGEEMMSEAGNPEVMDAALIAAAQRVEHYEMAGYGTVRSYARLLGNEQAAKLLQQTLDEEGQADEKLSDLAESIINAQAQRPA